MKPTKPNRFLSLISVIALAANASATDLYWDGGTANIATNGDGASSFLAGTWSTTLTNWDQGAGLAHVAWNNANLDNAIFGGTLTAGTKVITLGSSVTVNQIKILTGDPATATSANRYDIGVATDAVNAITFGGTYNDTTPAIDASAPLVRNNNFPAKVTGTPSGGLVIAHGSNITTPGFSGRFALTNTNCDFVGDVIMTAGNLSVGSQMGNASNKLVLKGGALFVSGAVATTTTYVRNIDVASASGLATNAASSGLQVLDLTGTITGAANLTRYANVTSSATSEVRFSGSMSGFTGTFENVGPTATSIATVQTTATTGGAWKLSGGTLKLNTASNDAAIANGSGKSDLLMNGGILDMNGKSETINGLSGATGTVQNQATTTASVLTLGDGDATATFSGSINDNTTAAGTVAITKIGTGTQTLAGALTYTGATNVNAGTLNLTTSASTLPSAVTVAPSATLGLRLSTFAGSTALASLATGTGAGSTLVIDSVGKGLSNVTAPITCTGAFTPGTGATTLIKLKGYAFNTGVYPLIAYNTLGGAGFAGLDKQLPYRMVATLVDNSGAKTVDLNITSAETAVWKGEVGGTANGAWDIDPDGAGSAGTLNWKTSVAGTAIRYAQGAINTDQVRFDDNLSGTGTTTVNLTTTLTPTHVLVNNTTAKTYTFTGSGKLSGETSLEKNNDGTLIIANTTLNDYTGGTVITNGTLQLGDGSTVGAGRISGTIANDFNLVFNHPDAMTADNVITGGSGGFVIKKGTNTLTLSGASTYSGATFVSKGTLAAAAATAFGLSTVTLGDADSGTDPITLRLDNRMDVANAVTVGTDGTGTATLAASNTGTGTADPASFTGTVTLNRATTFRSDIVGDRLTFTGRITGAPGTLTIAGGNTVALDKNTNDFTGDITVTGTGTILLASPTTTTEVIPNTANVNLDTGTFLKLFAVGTENIAGLTGTGTVARHESSTSLTILNIGANNASSIFDGVIRNALTGTGTIGLTKSGTGSFTLNGTNLYTGATLVSDGSLLVNGSIASAVSANGGTIGGTGTVGAITANATGKVSPATATTTGTLTTTGNVTLVAGTAFIAQINSNGTPASDRLAVTGTLALGNATLTATDLGSTTLPAATRLVLATATTGITGTFSGIANNADVVIGGNAFKIKYDDTEVGIPAVTLNKASSSGYAAWATANGVGASDTDYDNDGVKNGVEYVLGTDPKVPTSGGITASTTATNFLFTFTRSDASETPDTTVVIETSNDLVTWTADASPYTVGATSSGSVTIVENPAFPAADPGTDTVSLTVPRNTAAKFARLKVVVGP